MIQVYEIPLDRQFVAVWEYNGMVWSNSFIYAGESDAGVKYFDPYNLSHDCHDTESRNVAFFLQFPHKLFISSEAEA